MGAWLAAYGVTLAFEVPVVLVLWWALGRLTAVGVVRTLAWAWVANLTHPVLWLLHPGSWAALAVAEAIVALAEGVVYGAGLRRARAGTRPWAVGMLTALVANAASWAFGTLLYALGVLPA